MLTNPPFGGEEEASVKNNFPADKQTAVTALLFLQLIMRRLRRPGHVGSPGGRAAAQGVFAPYRDIQTNVLIFDHTGATDEIWFYEHVPRPAARTTPRPSL